MKHIVGIAVIHLVIWSSSQSTNCYAYTPENHKIITQLAIDYILKTKGANFLSEDEINDLIKGNVSEDKSIFKFPQRLHNWHFYNPDKEGVRIVCMSSNERLVTLTRRYNRSIRNRNNRVFRHAGELIHHLQDMTNPAHAVPIYHGPGQKDKFDELTISRSIALRLNTLAIVDDGLGITDYVWQIMYSAVSTTLENIREPFVAEVTDPKGTSKVDIDWTYFYKQRSKKWMGKYGILGRERVFKIDRFGDEIIEVPKLKQTWKIAPSVYAAFRKQQIEYAVNYTIELILFTKKRMN